MDSFMADIREHSDSDGIWTLDPHRLAVVAINVVWSSVGGYRFDPKCDLIKRHIDMSAEVFEILRPNNLLSTFPFLKIFPEMSGYKRHGEIHKRCWAAMEDMVNDAKQKWEGRDDTEPESFVEVFLAEIKKNQNNPESPMTEDQLIAVLMDLFLAGTDTTSTVMSWLILYFVLYPEVQLRAQADILKMSENGTKQIPLAASLPYISACILEVIRHSPFGTVPPAREAITDIYYDDYVIPKGTCVLANLHAVFYDKEFWGDPENFRPERLLDYSGTGLDPVKVERITIEFGFGKRVCPGESLAMDTLFGFVISILGRFSIDVVPGRKPALTPGPPGLSICPMPFAVKFRPLH